MYEGIHVVDNTVRRIHVDDTNLPLSRTQPGSPVNRILHLSDLHVDLAYTPGLSNDCGEPLCCRPPNKPGML